MPSDGLSIHVQAFKIALDLLSPSPNPSSGVFEGILMMAMVEVPFYCNNWAFKDKIKAHNNRNRVGSKKPRRKTSKSRKGGRHVQVLATTTARGRHHTLPVVATGCCGFRFSFVAAWCSARDHGIWHGLVMVRLFWPLLLASLIFKASKIFFYPYTWSYKVQILNQIINKQT